MPAVPLVPNGTGQSSIFCDNGPDYCSVVVNDDGADAGTGGLDSPTTTVVIPVTFSPGASACPTSDPQLFTDSGFSVEHLIPAATAATCEQKNGVVAINTATNTGAITSDLAAGGASVAFTDDPWDPALTGQLKTSSYVYIPVALSATVVGFLGGVPSSVSQGVSYPVSNYNLTPNMAAGVLTTAYEGGGVSDSLVNAPAGLPAPLDCTRIAGCKKSTEFQFNSFYMLNPQPAGVGQPSTLGSYFANSVAGSNYELSQWICNSPNTPFNVTVRMVGKRHSQPVSVVDPNTATATLTTPPTQSPFWGETPPSLWPFTSCTPTSQFPTISPGSLVGYGPADTPALQAKAIRGFGGGQSIGFGAMDWSEASFWGLYAASLQNAAGRFMTPTTSSITAALADATTNPNGSLSFNFGDAGNVNAYPMPMVTYAVVPKGGVPSDQVAPLTNFLSNLVAYSSGQHGPLPGGYVALPGLLSHDALSDISHDIVAQPATSTDGSQNPDGSGGGSNVSSDQFSNGFTSAGDTGSVSENATQATTGTDHPGHKIANGTQSEVGGAAGVDIVATSARLVLPALLILTAAALIAGPLLVVWPRRRRATPAGVAPDTPSEGGP